MDSHIDRVEKTLLEILRREVTGEDGTEKMELSVAGLKAVMRLAQEHAVTGLVANAAVRNRIVIAGSAAEGRGEAVMRLMQQTMAHRQNQRRFEVSVSVFTYCHKKLIKRGGLPSFVSLLWKVANGLAIGFYNSPMVHWVAIGQSCQGCR